MFSTDKTKGSKTSRSYDLESFSKLDAKLKIEFLVSLANLAPSSHNMQPWLFRILDRTIVILPNHKLRLSVADPQAREFYITLGTVMGALKIVSQGYGLNYEYQKGSDLSQEIGRFTFTNLEPNNPDYERLTAFVNRHNSRLPFRKDGLPSHFLEKIKSLLPPTVDLVIVDEPDQKKVVERNIIDSVREAFADKAFCLELAPWVKRSIGHHEDGLPGYNLGMPFLASLIFPFMIRNMNISNLQVKIHKRMLDNSAVYALISSNEETPQNWLSIGEIFIQIAVEAEKNKISLGVMQASIENPKNREELIKLMGSDKLPQMFFRLGYCSLKHKHSPRRPLNKVLLNS